MDSQIKYISKEELHKMIDEFPEGEFMIMTYDKDKGISDNGKMVNKNKTKILANKSTLIILTEGKPIMKVDLEGDFGGLFNKNRNIIKSILIPKLEWENIIVLIHKIHDWQKRTYVLIFIKTEQRFI